MITRRTSRSHSVELGLRTILFSMNGCASSSAYAHSYFRFISSAILDDLSTRRFRRCQLDIGSSTPFFMSSLPNVSRATLSITGSVYPRCAAFATLASLLVTSSSSFSHSISSLRVTSPCHFPSARTGRLHISTFGRF